MLKCDKGNGEKKKQNSTTLYLVPCTEDIQGGRPK